MKASINRNYFFNLFNKPITTKWQRELSMRLRWPHLLRWLSGAVTQLKNYVRVDARRIYQDGRVACRIRLASVLVAAKEARSNKRFCAGVIVALVALPTWRCHLFFDLNERIEGFYYVNYAFYLNTIRGYLAFVFIVTGAFIAMPQKWAFRWWAVPIVGFCATEIYAQYFYTDYTDFYNAMPGWQVSVIAILCMLPLFFSVDYLVYRYYHLKSGPVSRIIGIAQAPNVEAERKIEVINGEAEQIKNYNSRI